MNPYYRKTMDSNNPERWVNLLRRLKSRFLPDPEQIYVDLNNRKLNSLQDDKTRLFNISEEKLLDGVKRHTNSSIFTNLTKDFFVADTKKTKKYVPQKLGCLYCGTPQNPNSEKSNPNLQRSHVVPRPKIVELATRLTMTHNETGYYVNLAQLKHKYICLHKIPGILVFECSKCNKIRDKRSKNSISLK